jgi:hypothetical protein
LRRSSSDRPRGNSSSVLEKGNFVGGAERARPRLVSLLNRKDEIT